MNRRYTGSDAVELVALGSVDGRDELGYIGVGFGEPPAHRMVGCQREIGRPVEPVKPLGEDIDLVTGICLEGNRHPLAATDPVPLSLFHTFGPLLEIVESVK